MPDIPLKAVSVGAESVALEADGSCLWIGSFRGTALRLEDLKDGGLVPWEAEWGTRCGYGKSPQGAVDAMVTDARRDLVELQCLVGAENA